MEAIQSGKNSRFGEEGCNARKFAQEEQNSVYYEMCIGCFATKSNADSCSGVRVGHELVPETPLCTNHKLLTRNSVLDVE